MTMNLQQLWEITGTGQNTTARNNHFDPIYSNSCIQQPENQDHHDGESVQQTQVPQASKKQRNNDQAETAPENCKKNPKV
ncbi:hypothetical protein DV515_00006307 [Chloebia gouldiae]|uniref:Uncharacterized protein n=1 Tax=Chloebia gouldiae TaxID=44316 RepID=A0A3L8SKN0_CHLGU|nr:hypothetical protein DV515_00006307 [Chloebia gouldiae]